MSTWNELIPPALWRPSAKAEVIKFITGLRLSGQEGIQPEQLLREWAKFLGVTLKGEDFQSLKSAFVDPRDGPGGDPNNPNSPYR